VGIDELQCAVREGRLEDVLYSVDRALESHAAALLTTEHVLDVRSGRSTALQLAFDQTEPASGSQCRAYSASGEFLGVLSYRGSGLWHPSKVFAAQ
jgi:hypothetical protein